MCCENSGMIHIWIIQEPPPDQVQPYLDMGWYRVRDVECDCNCLQWSFARGTPSFPGGEEERVRRHRERDDERRAMRDR